MFIVRSRRLWFSLAGLCLLVLLAACGSTGNGPGTTPTPVGNTPTAGTTTTPGMTPPANGGGTPPTQTSCPVTGTARAAIMPSLALGSHQNIVYIVNEYQGNTATFGTLKRYDVTTGAKTEVVKIPNVTISDAQLSANGQWILFVATTGSQVKLQLVRMDGLALQTLYCASPASNGANPASAISSIQWSSNQQLAVFNSYAVPTSHLYLLNMQNGTLQAELSVSSGAMDTSLTWLDNTRLYVFGPEVDAPPQALYILDTSRGANQNPNSLTKVFDATNATATTNFCWNADSSYDGTQLFTSQCTTTPNPSGPGIGAQRGPSTISVRSATGGTAHTIFTSSTMAITSVRAISKTTLLLIVNNNGTGTNVDTSHNGLWKINVDGTGLTQLASAGAGVSGGPGFLSPFTQYPWSNVSRDGGMFALEHDSGSGSSSVTSLLFGPIHGGTTTTFASISAGTQLQIVGWTTM